MNTPTPETDAVEWAETNWANACVTADFARKLERERDELQNAISGLCEHFGITPANYTLLAVELLRMKRERDEARTIIEDAKRALNGTDYEGILLAAMRVKEERDEAREQRDEWKSKYIQQNKDLGCEQMDPDGTIWDYAKKVQTDLSAMTEQRDRMAEILRGILAVDKGDKPHDYWALQDHAQANAMAFDAWQEILRKIEESLETKP